MAFNTENYIEKAVRSVLNQTVSEVEIYIRDNGSTDHTPEILSRLVQEDARVHVIRNQVNGVTGDGLRCFDLGWWPVDQSEAGEYVTILDSDDYLAPDFVEKLYAAAEESGAQITFCGSRLVDEDGEFSGARKAPQGTFRDLSSFAENLKPLYDSFRTWWGKLFRTDFFFDFYDKAWGTKEVPGGRTRDTVVMMRYLAEAQTICGISDPLYYFLQRKNSTYSDRVPTTEEFFVARSIYIAALRMLEKKNIATQENLSFLCSVHLGYFYELIRDFPNMRVPIEWKLNWLQEFVNDELLAEYGRGSFARIYGLIRDEIDRAPRYLQMNQRDHEDLAWFLGRLHYAILLLDQEGDNSLPFAEAKLVLLGVLCDPRNRTAFGEQLLMELPNRSRFLNALLSVQQDMRIARYRIPEQFRLIFYWENLEDEKAIADEKQRMKDAWQKEQYDEAFRLSGILLSKSEYQPEAAVLRAAILMGLGEERRGILLWRTIRILWPKDLLCSVIGQFAIPQEFIF